MVIKHHYSGRCPGVKYAFGLYEKDNLVGCVVFAVPASYTLCEGVCGSEFKESVIELARLVIITTTSNAASYLIGRALRKLPPCVVVSYADCNDHIGHVGYVYQATNWLYTGRSAAEPVYVLARDHPSGLKAGTVVSYTRRHIDAKARELGFPWSHNASNGPGLIRRKTVGKHRYIYFAGRLIHNTPDGKVITARECLRYRVLPYPKGPTRRHVGNVMQVMNRSFLKE